MKSSWIKTLRRTDKQSEYVHDLALAMAKLRGRMVSQIEIQGIEENLNSAVRQEGFYLIKRKSKT